MKDYTWSELGHRIETLAGSDQKQARELYEKLGECITEADTADAGSEARLSADVARYREHRFVARMFSGLCGGGLILHTLAFGGFVWSWAILSTPGSLSTFLRAQWEGLALFIVVGVYFSRLLYRGLRAVRYRTQLDVPASRRERVLEHLTVSDPPLAVWVRRTLALNGNGA